MTTLLAVHGPGEIIYTQDLDGLVVHTFVVTPEGDVVAVKQEEKR